jgi:hypothetical protein
VIQLERTRQGFHDDLVPDVQEVRVIFTPLEPRVHVVQGVFYVGQSRLRGFLHPMYWLCRCARLRERCLRGRIRISVDQRMSRRSTFDLSQAHEVATLEVAIPVLELPER